MKKFVEKYKGLNIFFEALNDELDFNGWEKIDIERTIKQLNNYEIVCFCAKVSAVLDGVELASEYLGQCIYETEESFYSDYYNDYFVQMRDGVVNEIKNNLNSIIREKSNELKNLKNLKL